MASRTYKKRSLWRRLGSHRLGQFLLGTWLVLVLIVLVPRQFLATGEPVRHFAYSRFVVAFVYAPLALATIACMLQRMPVLRRRLTASGRQTSVRPDEAVALGGSFDRDRALLTLRKAGYRHVVIDEAGVSGVARRFAPIGNLLLHTGLLLLLLGALLTTLPGQTFVGRVRIAQGESFDGSRSSYFESAHGGQSPVARVPAVTLTAASSEVAADGQPTSLVAELRRGGRRIRLDAATPWFASLTTVVSLEDVDETAFVSIAPTGGPEPTASAEVLTDTSRRRPASLDFAVARGVYHLVARRALDAQAPNAVVVTVGGSTRTGGYRLIAEDRPLAVGAVLRAGGTRVRVDRVAPVATLRVTQSPATPVIALAVLLCALGPLLRLVSPRRVAIISPGPDGAVVAVRVDAYRTSAAATRRIASIWRDTP